MKNSTQKLTTKSLWNKVVPSFFLDVPWFVFGFHWLSLVFHWFSFVFSLVFIDFSLFFNVFHWFSLVFHWFSLVLMVSGWFFNGFGLLQFFFFKNFGNTYLLVQVSTRRHRGCQDVRERQLPYIPETATHIVAPLLSHGGGPFVCGRLIQEGW